MNRKYTFLTVLLLTSIIITGLLKANGIAAQAGNALRLQELEENGFPPAHNDMVHKHPAHAEEVPAEIQALFADGMTAEEFVQMTGYVPRALESLIEGDALMIIEFEAAPLAVYHAEHQAQGRSLASSVRSRYVQQLETAQARVQAQLAQMDMQVISNYTVVYNGIQARIPYNRLNEIRAMPGVKAIHPAPIHEPALGASVPLIGAPEVWNELEFDGEGIVIAIIDTGIDYTHMALGGSGDITDYEDAIADTTIILPGTFPTEKVIAGWDFAGPLYHAGCSVANEAAGICTTTPISNPNPLDVNGHGTHVAATAAGIGYEGMGAGVAPEAKLVALKVFGDVAGSTALTLDALEWATENYIEYGWPQVINMSLGSNFGTDDPEDPSVKGSQAAAEAGIVVVASSGNAGDNAYITGSPATADKAISVAASTTGYVTGPTIDIADTEYITQTNIIYTPASFDDNTGHYEETTIAPLAYVGELTATNTLCSIVDLAPDALEDQIALIQRGGCTFSEKVNNAAALGAVGTIIYNNEPGPFGGIGDPVTIPAAFIQMPDGVNLIPAHDQDVIVAARDEVKTVPDPYTPADTIATFSSRGPRGFDSWLKPEITAPGVGIFAADVGTGSGGVSMGGTSMAAPHVAGVAALMVQANPEWTPEEIKAAMMNTAATPVLGATIPRAGAGRIDAYRAVNTEVYAVGDADLISLNWGVPMSRNDTWTDQKHVTVHNTGDVAQVFTATVSFQEGSMTTGAALMVYPEVVNVPSEGYAVVTVTLDLDMTQIPVLYGTDGLEEYYGYVTFTPEGVTPPVSIISGPSAEMLGVPFYFQPRPYSQLEEIEVHNDTIADFEADTAVFTLTHRGPITSSLLAFPALAWNPEPNMDMAGPGDVRLFGMDYGWIHAKHGDIVAVAINTHDYWHVPQPFFAEFDLYIDANQDGEPDFVNFNYNLGWWQGADHTNQWIVVQVDLTTDNLYLGSPFLIYTDYNASYMEWYLPAEWQGFDPDNSTFDYQLLGFDSGAGISESPVGSFDYINYPFNLAISNDPSPADREANVEVRIASSNGYIYSQPLGVMIVDYNGDPRNVNGGQAYFEPVSISVEPATVEISGPGEGLAGKDYGYSVRVLPEDTTLPLTYTWEATDIDRVVHERETITDTYMFMWDSPGRKFITITVRNEVGVVSDTTRIDIEPLDITFNKAVAPSGNVSSGGVLRYTLTYTNPQDATIRQAVITDALPNHTVFLDTENQGEFSEAEGIISWTLPEIEPESSGAVTFRVRIGDDLEEGTNITNTAYFNAPATGQIASNGVSNSIAIQPDFSLSHKSATGDGTIAPGELITYTITYINSGTEPGYGVRITDPLHQDVAVETMTAGGAYDAQNHQVVFDIGTVDTGTSETVTLTVRVDPEAHSGTRIENYAIITANQIDPLHTNQVTHIVAGTALELHKSVTPVHNINPGEVLTYTLTYTNTGTATATEVVVQDAVPAGTRYHTGDYDEREVESDVFTVLRWNIAELEPGEQGDITFSVQALGGVVNVINRAAIRSAQQEDWTWSNAVTNTVATPAVEVYKSATPADTIPSGGEITYTLRYENTGEMPVNDVVIVDHLPEGVTYLSGDSRCIISTSVVTCTLNGELSPEQSGTVDFSVQVDAPEGEILFNTAHIFFSPYYPASSSYTPLDIEGNDNFQPLGGSRRYIAQSFIATAPWLDRLSVYVYGQSSPYPDFRIQLWEDTENTPDQNQPALVTSDWLALEQDGQRYFVQSPAPLSLTIGARYWLVVEFDPDSTGRAGIRFRGNNPYPQGSWLLSENGIDWTIPGPGVESAMNFRVEYIPPPHSNQVVHTIVKAPTCLAVSPSNLSFSAVLGGTDPISQTLQVDNCDIGRVHWTASYTVPWLTITPAGGVAPSQLHVRPSITDLDVGTYIGTITIYGDADTKESPQEVRVQLNIGSGTVYLPLVMRNWPPLPETPRLSIEETGTHSHRVSWNQSTNAVSFILERRPGDRVAGRIPPEPTLIVETTDTFYDFDKLQPTRYSYRVRAQNNFGMSDWSPVEYIDMVWELENNDTLSDANGPLVLDVTYYGVFDDRNDYFYIDFTQAQNLTIAFWDGYERDSFALRDSAGEVVPNCFRRLLSNPTLTINCSVPQPGRYYLQVYHDQGDNNPANTTYRFTITSE